MKYRSWLASHAESQIQKKQTFVNNLASFRYILYCYCVALQTEYDRKYLFDPILEGLRKPSVDVEDDQDQLSRIIDELIERPDKNVTLDKSGAALRLLSGLAPKLSVQAHELFAEEASHDPGGLTQDRRLLIERDNSVTHEIEIYFLEEKGSYFKLFQDVLGNILG